MKKAAIMSLIMFTILAVPSFSIISPGLSYLSNDQIMSKVLPTGKIDLSAKLEYWSAYELVGNSAFVMMGIAAGGLSSYTLTTMPLRISYGLTNNLSLRFTAQIVDRAWVYSNFVPSESRGYGLGDSKIEALYQICQETSEKPSLAVNVGADVLTGRNILNQPTFDTDTSLSTGMLAPSYYISGIIGKKCGDWDKKLMLGWIFPSADIINPNRTHFYATQWIMSAMMSTKAGSGIEWGGEISAKVSGPDSDDRDRLNLEATAITRISVAPFIVWQQSKDMSVKGLLDIPLAMKGNYSAADFGLNEARGINLSVGVDWVI